MSVLYKALQKAEKENELRQTASSDSTFDPQRLAASGALKMAGAGRGRNLKQFVMAAVVVVVVGGGSAFLLLTDPAPAPKTALATVDLARAPGAAEPVLQPPAQPPSAMSESGAPQPAVPAETVVAQDPPAVPTQGTAPSEAAIAAADTQPPVVASTAPAPAVAPSTLPTAEQPAAKQAETPSETMVAAAPPVTESRAVTAAARQMPQRPAGPAAIPANSPARMLSPPISINRSEFAMSGVGDQVQVRQVSQSARSNVAAGYDALIRGSYDMALGFYDAALVDEPNSVLGLLGRAAALQKLGRGQDAQMAYEQVLKLDPSNREALTNMTSIVGDSSPQEALNRLLDLERQYATFSPIKAQIGLAYAKLGSYPQALDYLRRATALTPNAVMYRYNLALVLDHLGRKEQAASEYEGVLSSISGGRGPADLSAVDIERRVRFLRAR